MSARLGLERILRRIFQFLISALGPLTRPPAAGVGGVDLLLVRGQSPLAAGVGVETPASLRDLHRGPALAGGVGQRLDPGGVDGVDDAVLAGGAPCRAGPRQRWGDPDQPAGRVRDDLHVEPVALVYARVDGRSRPPVMPTRSKQSPVEDDVAFPRATSIA